MKTETLFDPNYILATYPDKDDLLFYLKSKFESPSIELYINGHGVIEGFTCASLDGTIYTTLKKPATVTSYNYSIEGINEHNETLRERTEMVRIYRDELKNAKHTIFFLKIGFFSLILFGSWLFIQHHQQRNIAEKLKLEISQLKK